MRTRLSFLAAAVAGVLLFTGPPPAAAGTAALPLPDFGDLVVDQAHRRVYVSGGVSSNSVVAVDFTGRVVKQVTGQFGATGLALSADGKTLYVAQAAGDAIAAIRTDTLAETARYPTGAQTCPTHLARTGSVVWFGYGCDDTWTGRIGKLDTAAVPPAVALDQQGDARFQGAPLVASAGPADGPVVAGQLNLSLSTLRVFTVSAGALVPGAAGEVVGSNLTDIAVSPDGTTGYAAAGSRPYIQGLSTADLSGRGSYATAAYPNAATVSTGGAFLATGAFTSRGKAIAVFRIGETVPVRDVDLGGSVLANRGLAWSADDKTLFAVLQGAADPRPTLTAITRIP